MGLLGKSSIVLSVAALGLAGAPECHDLVVPVTVSTPALTFQVPQFHNSSESTQFLLESVSRTANPAALIGKPSAVNATYKISVKHCEPCDGKGNGVTQLLTHGIGFDKSYWEFGGSDNNYIAAVTAEGYSTVSYDRLGVGKSDHPDPYFEVQALTELAILAGLTEKLRAGSLSPQIAKASKVVHVGHSFGSLLSNALVGQYPALSDGAILTGFSFNSSYLKLWELCLGFRLAKEVDPKRFGNLSSGYIIWQDKYDNQCAFLTYPYFSVDSLEVAEATKQTVTVGELVSVGSMTPSPSTFKGPVQIITGSNDVPFCGGNCTGIVDDLTIPKALFPNVSALAGYIQPKTGHGINAHYNASGAYNVITQFLKSNNL